MKMPTNELISSSVLSRPETTFANTTSSFRLKDCKTKPHASSAPLAVETPSRPQSARNLLVVSLSMMFKISSSRFCSSEGISQNEGISAFVS